MVAAPRPAIRSGRRSGMVTAPELAVPSLPVRTVDLYGAVTLFSIRPGSQGENMGFGADQLEALAECVDLINTGRTCSAAPSRAPARPATPPAVGSLGRP